MIDNSKDLGKAMKAEKDNIELENDFGKRVVCRIKFEGNCCSMIS